MGMDDMVGSVGKSAAKLAQAAIVPVTSAELSPSLTSSSKLSSSLDVNHRDDTAVPYLARIANAMEAGQDVYIDDLTAVTPISPENVADVTNYHRVYFDIEVDRTYNRRR